MSTLAEVRRIAKPLLARHDDLAMIGRMIVVLPVRHVLRAVYLGGSSGRGQFRVTRMLLPLFLGRDHLSSDWSEPLHDQQFGFWSTLKPGVETALHAIVEAEGLPILRPVQTIADFRAFVWERGFMGFGLRQDALSRSVIEAALGELDAAEASCDEADRGFGRGERLGSARERVERITLELGALITARDRAGIAALLHAWEAETVKNLKLEKVWEPTPFPVEM